MKKIYRVRCLTDSGDGFTKGKVYKIDSEGIVDDGGYCYKFFLDIIKGNSPADKWIKWSSEGTLNVATNFALEETPIRRF